MENILEAMEVLTEAVRIAKEVHVNDTYGDESYYDGHLKVVVRHAYSFSTERNFSERILLMSAALLHDTIEDTDGNKDSLMAEIKEKCGEYVFGIAWATTDGKGETRKERKAAAYEKIKQNGDALYIKLCDRLANVEAGGKVEMYKKEHVEFRKELYNGEFDSLWNAIEKHFV